MRLRRTNGPEADLKINGPTLQSERVKGHCTRKVATLVYKL